MAKKKDDWLDNVQNLILNLDTEWNTEGTKKEIASNMDEDKEEVLRGQTMLFLIDKLKVSNIEKILLKKLFKTNVINQTDVLEMWIESKKDEETDNEQDSNNITKEYYKYLNENTLKQKSDTELYKSIHFFKLPHHGTGLFNGAKYSDNNIFEDASIGSALGDYIKEKDINQTRLAQLVGVDRVTISNIIKKPSSVSLLNAYKISKVLGEDISTLFPFLLYDENDLQD